RRERSAMGLTPRRQGPATSSQTSGKNARARRRWPPRAAVSRPYPPLLEELEPRSMPSVSLAISDPAPVLEGSGMNLVFVVSRTGDQVPLQVNSPTKDGPAHAGTDYTAESGPLSFTATQNTATIDVPVLNNNTFNGQRTFAVLLSSPIVGAAFQPQQTFAVGNSPFAVAVGDFTGDGK